MCLILVNGEKSNDVAGLAMKVIVELREGQGRERQYVWREGGMKHGKNSELEDLVINVIRREGKEGRKIKCVGWKT